MKRACNVITQQLHSKYKSRGRVKLHALNSASIEPEPNSPAVEGKQERRKHGRTVLIKSSQVDWTTDIFSRKYKTNSRHLKGSFLLNRIICKALHGASVCILIININVLPSRSVFCSLQVSFESLIERNE